MNFQKMYNKSNEWKKDNLKYLDLSGNYLNGNLPEIIKGSETCSSKSPFLNLRELHLSWNQLMGKLPNWLGELKNLRGLYLSITNLKVPSLLLYGHCNTWSICILD